MAIRTIDNIREALGALSKLVGTGHVVLEGAPKAEGDDGPVAGGLWHPVQRDLSDVPRGQRWLIRKVGGGRGKKAKGVVDYIAVCLIEDVALVGFTPSQTVAARAIEAGRWELLAMREDIVEMKNQALSALFERISDLQGIVGQGITHANNAGSSAALVAELTRAQAELLDDLSQAKSNNNTSLGIMHIVNRLITSVQLRRVKSWAELKGIPEFQKDIKDFMEWRDSRDAPPPSGDIDQ